MRTVDLLKQLQDIDTQTEAAEGMLPRLQREIGDRGPLADREAELGRAQRELRALETQQRDLELDADRLRAKIAADEAKLYGGRVTNPRELTSLSDEVAQDRRQLSPVEDRLLDVFDRTDRVSARITELKTALVRETEVWSARQEVARAQQRESEAAVASLQDQRTALLEQVDPRARATYESLRHHKGGLAVAQVNQRTCQACRVALTPAQEQRARMGADLVTCHSCGRILYVRLT